jgi:hypothetical protein
LYRDPSWQRWGTAIIDCSNDHDLIIFKDGEEIATGDFNDQDLLVLNEEFLPCQEKELFQPARKPVKKKVNFLDETPVLTKNKFSLLSVVEKEHAIFGHLGCTSDICDTCILTKRRRKNTPKSSTPKEQLAVLEKVHVDIQGPFPIASIDGSKMNIKAVDSHSGYVKLELIHDKSAATTTDFIRRFHVRSERQTGAVLKAICTDSGTEFNGTFLAYLEDFGITKRKGHGYVHHYPPDAENANRIILMMARAMLLQSKLPANYYGEAMLCASYLLNRWSQKGSTSRYEKFFKKKPRVDHLRPFGSICFAFIPAEKRSKLEQTREKCRLIGYGDDDDTEEMSGYKLLVESDNSILYSNDVVFSSQDIKELPNSIPYEPEVLEIFSTPDVDYVFTETDSSGTTAGSGETSVLQPDGDLPSTTPVESDDNVSDTSEDLRQEAILRML